MQLTDGKKVVELTKEEMENIMDGLFELMRQGYPVAFLIDKFQGLEY